MNSEQLQDWLTVVNEEFKGDEKALKEIDGSRGLLFKQVEKSHCLVNFLYSSYSDVSLTQPILAQLLASYYRGGILRYFALQFLPCLIHVYLLVLAKRQRKSVSMLETFLTAIYNEEILVKNVGEIEKKVEEVRIPSLRYPSVYHDPKRLNVGPEVLQLRPTSPIYVQKTIRIGPYDTIEKVTAENRPTVLTRLLKAVNTCLRHLPDDVVCRYLCSSTNAICHSGFSFGESDFVSRLLHDTPVTVAQDYSRKPRIRLSSQYLLEALNGVYFSLFNGSFEIKMMAVRVIDVMHQRAIYEMFADVTLVTNSVRSSLLEKSFFQNEEIAAIKRSSFAVGGRNRSELVTNASLRLRKMPEDIVVTDDDESNAESPHKKDSSFAEGVENLKKKVAQKFEQSRVKGEYWLEQQKAKSGSFLHGARLWKHTRTISVNSSDLELTQINEETKVTEEAKQTDAVIDEIAESPLQPDDPLFFKRMEDEGKFSSKSPDVWIRIENDGDGSEEGGTKGRPKNGAGAGGDDNYSDSEDLPSRLGAVTSGQSLRHMDSLVDALENIHF